MMNDKMLCGVCTPRRTIIFNEELDGGNPYYQGRFYPFTIRSYAFDGKKESNCVGVRYFDDESEWGVIFLTRAKFNQYFRTCHFGEAL